MELFNDDCLKILPQLEDNSVDFFFTDLPYGQVSCSWDCKIDLEEMWVQLNRVCKVNCPMFFTCTTKFGIELINSNPKNFRYDIFGDYIDHYGWAWFDKYASNITFKINVDTMPVIQLNTVDALNGSNANNYLQFAATNTKSTINSPAKPIQIQSEGGTLNIDPNYLLGGTNRVEVGGELRVLANYNLVVLGTGTTNL